MDRLSSDSTLDKGNELMSPNGNYKLKMQADGNLVLYGGDQPIWATNTQRKGAERLVMQDDGNLVVYANGKDDVWSSRTNRNKGAYLMLQDDGNLVVYSKDGKDPLWASDTKGKWTPPPTPAPTPAAVPAAAGAAAAGVTMQDKAANQAAAAPVAKPAVAANAGAPAKTAAASKKANARTYTVAKGDSLWKIAEKIYGSGTDYKKIAKANHISNPDHIQPGQKLVIPD
ncbi:MAG TPA: LysM peptidoglycan-binding domain-containing protein [Micromonosporaceae bacterium]|jgi:nucleoid-associated protein YgaU